MPAERGGLVRIALHAAIALLAFLYIRHNWGFALDDSFITFRYADNLRSGYGLTFNPGETFYGTTAAGYAILLWLFSYPVDGLLALLDAPRMLGAGSASIPAASTILSGLSLAAIAAMGVRIVERRAPCLPGYLLAALSGFLLFTSFPGNAVAAHETYSFLAVALAGTYAYLIAGRPIAAAILLGLAACLRPDADLIAALVLAAGAAAAYACNEQPLLLRRLSAPAAFALAFAAITICWLAFLRFNFGRFLPETLVAKQTEVTLGFPAFEPSSLWSKLRAFDILPIAGLGAFSLLTFVALRVGTKRVGPHEAQGGGLLLLALVWISWAAGESLAYVLLRVSIWDWYVIAILFAIGFAAFAFALWVISAAWRSPDPAAKGILAGAFLAAATAGMFLIAPGTGAALAHWAEARRVNGHLTSYQKAIDFIRSDAPTGAVIAISEPGTFGFKLGPAYRIVDELGLVSPGVARALAAGDMDYPFRVWKPQYIVLTWHGPYTPEGRPWLAGDYDQVLKFTDPYWAWNHLDGAYVYRRKPGR